MARAARKTIKTKPKKAPRVARTSSKSILAEEKHIGYETTDWAAVDPRDFDAKVRETMNHYNYFYDHKTVTKWARQWAKVNLTKLQYTNLRAAEDWRISRTAGQLSKMAMNGAKFDKARTKWLKNKLMEAVDAGKAKNKASKNSVVFHRKSPGELLKERASDLIADIDEIIDQTFKDRSWDKTDFKMYDFLKTHDVPYINAKRIADYLQPTLDEFVDLTKNKPDDLVEGYTHLGGIRIWNRIKRFYQGMIDDLNLHMGTKKTVRKPRTQKAKTASAQVQGLKFRKESAEYKIASVDPSTIVGASQVYLFNTKTRVLSCLLTNHSSGFTVARTSIKNVDPEKSTKKKLRKPEDFFARQSRATKTKLAKAYTAVNTKGSSVNSSVQVNGDTIIWKVF